MATNVSEEKIEALDSSGCGLVVAVRKEKDRFGHSIFVAGPSGLKEVFRSVEGSDQQDWPPSPPIQDYSIEHREESSLVLAVGMAGKSHWSASFEAKPESKQIIFDIACRTNARPGSPGNPAEHATLQSTYLVNDDNLQSVSLEKPTSWKLPDGTSIGCTYANSDEQKSTMASTNESIIFAPIAGETPSLTTRWIYSFFLSGLEN